MAVPTEIGIKALSESSDTTPTNDMFTASESVGEARLCDPLLECLLRLGEIEGASLGRTAVTANLPLEAGRLTPPLFLRAAKRAGFDAKIAERAFDNISSLLLPAVLLLDNNDAVLLEKLEGERCQVYSPSLQKREEFSVKELANRYGGLCILCKKEAEIEHRIESKDETLEVHWFWGTLARSWRIYRDVLLASLFINLFVLANPLFVMNVYDRVVPNNAIETLWALAIGILLLFTFDFALRSLRTYFIEVAGKKADVLLSTFIMEKVLGAHFSQHPQSVGAFSSRVREFDTIRNFITASTVTTFVDLPFVVLFLIVIAYIGGAIVWVPIIAIPIILTYAWFVQERLKRLVSGTFLASAQKNATLVEALTNLETLKGLGAERIVLKKWESAVSALAFWSLRWRIFSNSATSFSAFIQQVASVFVIIVGVYSIAHNTLTQGALIACVILVSRALAPLAQLSGLLVQYHQSKLALQSLDEVVASEQEKDTDRKYIERPDFDGAIEFREVSFTYPNETQATLNNCSFQIKAKEKVGIIGRVGSGKSTLSKLLLNLYRQQSGAILIDGIDISQIDPSELRSHIGYVPQDSQLFYGSIRDNIAYHHQHVSDSEVLRVSKVSGVSEFVDRHPQGLERVIGERGETLSGGQRQAVNIARGLVNQPSIVLLDEPTAAMDNATEAKILASLKTELAGHTLLLVTHKTSMLALVDRLIVVENGRVVADGEKSKVLAALQKGEIRGK
ncbi:MAG: type I secretion system permease/ATPase [Agarilytica sp.]